MMRFRKFSILLLSLLVSSFVLSPVFSDDAGAKKKSKFRESLENASEKMEKKGQAISDSNRVVIDASREAIAKANEVITPEQEYYIGRTVAAKVLDNYKLYNNTKATQYVNRICKSITSSSSMPDLYAGYFVGILDTKEINAISTPGGHILVTRGLIACAENEDQVAAVIAHEIAHIQLKHSVKAIKSNRAIEAIVSTADVAKAVTSMSAANEGLNEGANEVFTTVCSTGYSKNQEYEADQKAATLLADAGYNPNALIDVLKALEAREAEQTAGMVKTHPSAKSRIFSVRGFVRNAAYGKSSFNESKRTARFKSVKSLL